MLKHRLPGWIAVSALAGGLIACTSGSGDGSGTGGTPAGTGGSASGTGGVPATGGAPATGGTVGTGGRAGTGGAVGSGGAIGSGGSVGSGGHVGSGGSAGAGSGGSPGSGGGAGVGGKAGSGGSAGAGGGHTGSGGAAGAVGSGGSGSGGSGAAVASCPGAVPSGVTAAWCSCDLFGSWVSGPATVYNDVWGSGPGPQCIWAASASRFGLVANHPNSSGIKSYPNVSYSPGTAISAIGGYTSSFDISVPSGGSWESAYDIWVKNGSTRIEIMLWMYKSGSVGPIASSYDASGAVPDVSNVTVGGHTWNVYYGSNGSNDVVSLLRTSNTTSGMVDVKAILGWIISNKKSFTTSWTLDQVQFGFEITSDGSPQSFMVNSFSVTSS